jgi:hypothetical protein
MCTPDGIVAYLFSTARAKAECIVEDIVKAITIR